jgi:hypothetical protein
MAGAYVVTGFGTTYFGGNRDPGSFDLRAPKNRPWEEQLSYARRFFAGFQWWKLEPHDELLQCGTPRGKDGKEMNQTTPPEKTYWCLAEPGRNYIVYVRGLHEWLTISAAIPAGGLRGRQFNPRTGEFLDWRAEVNGSRVRYRPPDLEDWVLHLEAGR